MTVSDDVILDLLPLYRSGLASPASEHLVRAWLAAHPDFDARGRAPAAPAPADAAELRALDQARRLLRLRRRLYGISIGFTVLLLSVRIDFAHGQAPRFGLALLEYPLACSAVALCAAVSWFAYWRLSRFTRG